MKTIRRRRTKLESRNDDKCTCHIRTGRRGEAGQHITTCIVPNGCGTEYEDFA
jgi:hypothetical protein